MNRRYRATLAALTAALMLLPSLAAALPGPDISRPDRWFDDHVYHHHADLTTELEELAADHPHYISLTSIGTSVMGRELWTVRITDPSVPVKDKAQVYIDGEHHGNEYLGGELCILLIHRLLEDTDDPVVQQILRETVVWVTPMLNPDGNARDTRSNVNGVDLNRHYPFEFSPGGSRGDAPATEPEVAANVAFMEKRDLDLYITMHTGIVRLVHPWGWTYDPSPDQAMFDSLRYISESYGIEYGQASLVLYIVTGSSKDFAYGGLGTPGFTYEVDDEQTRQISAREDIAVRLGDELGLLEEMILAAPFMRARLEEHGIIYEGDASGGMSVSVNLHNPTWTSANNTTVTVEAYMDGSLVGTWSTLVDVPAGNDTMATVEFPLEDGDYVFRTLVDYPRMNVNNTSMGHMVLASHQHTVHTSVLGSSGGWGMGLLLLLIAIGAAVLYWAYKKGLWRPGRAYQKVMSRVSPDPEA